MKNRPVKNTVIYQAKGGAIEFRGDLKRDTVWGSLQQLSDLFNVQKPAISKHLRNIYEEGELDKKSTVSILETVQIEGGRQITRQTKHYNLNAILSVGYRVNSKQAAQFRIWATKTLKQHLLQGYSINKKRIGENYEKFTMALTEVKALLPKNSSIQSADILHLLNAFTMTWFSLDAYDKAILPTSGASKKQVVFNSEELGEALLMLKKTLIKKKQATKLFGQEQQKDSIAGIVGNVLQSAFGQDLYRSVEEKAVHLLYFMVKNHPFVDGNKRSGAFAFIWFLRKAGLLYTGLTPEALTAITLLVAESHPKDKAKVVGLIILLLSENGR